MRTDAFASRATSAGFALVFVAAAALQWNDPDPLRWIAAYGAAAALALAALLGHVGFWPSACAALAFAGASVPLLPSLLASDAATYTSFEMTSTTAEEAREAIGLLICAAYAAGLAWTSRRRHATRSGSDTGARGDA